MISILSSRSLHFSRGILFLCIGLTLLNGCKKRIPAVDRGVQEQVLHRAIGADIPQLDPHLATGVTEYSVISALFEGLVVPNPETLDPEPGIAKHWEISEDQLTYTFFLRKDAKWSNGSPLTAKDFRDSFRRILSPSLAAPNGYLLHVLRNAEAFHSGTLSDFSEVGVSVPDDRTLRLTLESPTSYFLTLLTHWAWFPVHLPTIEQYGNPNERGSDWTRAGRFVGNGPFSFEEPTNGQRMTVTKNPFYWDTDAVRLNAIAFYTIDSVDAEERAFRSGQIHITDALPITKAKTYLETESPALNIAPYLGTYFYRFNTTDPILSDVRIRKALTMAIDRSEIVKEVLFRSQQTAHAFTPPSTAGYTSTTKVKTNPNEARKLLAEAGYPEGKGFPPIKILFNSSENHKLIAEVVQAMWHRELGIEAQLINQELKVYLDSRRQLDYQVCRSSWIGDYVDPSSFLNIWTSLSGNNQTGWQNTAYDKLLRLAASEEDPGKRFDFFNLAEKILIEEAPIVPIYHYNSIKLIDPRVKGWYPNLLDQHPYKAIYLESP